MKKVSIFGGVAVAIVIIVILLLPSTLRESAITDEVWACNADAMLCPDGSSTGRTGPKCEFKACPSPNATFARIETYLGGRDGGLNLILKPREVLSDSRCAPEVKCVWAGTVEVKVEFENKVGHGEQVFRLGEPLTIGDLVVTLVEVRPSTQAETKDPEHSYWFVFEARKK